MGKWYGKVGFAVTVETAPGVWSVDDIVERYYYGEDVKLINKWQLGSGLNDDQSNATTISILADAFAYENFNTIKYIEFMGVKWKVTQAEFQRPRLLLTMGGVYNE